MSDRDTRIVEMQFDNRQFERNIAKSQRSLESFKEELDFEDVSKGITKFASGLNEITFDKLSENIQKLTDKFTGLGDATEYVMARIRASIEAAAMQLESFIKSFTTLQISAGQMKYDSMNKAVQTIVAGGKYTEEEAYLVFERMMKYTDQTSANFVSMADAITMFTSVGQGLTESERALEGIYNMTAKAGKGAAEATVAMSVFSKAMGQGYLDLRHWYSLNNSAHITTEEFRKTVLDTAVATGDLVMKNGKYFTKAKNGMASIEVTAENMQSTLSHKWFSKNTMMALFDKYYFAKLVGASEEELDSFAGVAYKSAQKAFTFADAMGAVREAVSSGWLTSFRLILGDVSEAMEFFTSLCERVIEGLEGIAESRNLVLSSWADLGGRGSLIEIILGDYGKSVETGAYGLLDLFQDIGGLISHGFWSMVKIFASGGEQNLWDEAGYKEAWLGVKLKETTDQIRDFIKGIKDFFTEEIEVGGKVTTRLEMIKQIIDGIVAVLAIGILIIAGIIHFVSGLKTQLQPSIDRITELFAFFGSELTEAAEEGNGENGIIAFFDRLLEDIKPLTDSINGLVISVADLLTKLYIFGKESGLFETIGELFTGAISLIAEIISKVGGPILDFASTVIDIFGEVFEDGFSKESLDKAWPKLKEAFRVLFTKLIDALPESMSGLGDALKDLFGLWGEDVERDTVFTRIHDFFVETFGGIIDAIKWVWDILSTFNFHDLFVTTMGGNFVGSMITRLQEWLSGVNLYDLIMAFLGVATLYQIFDLIRQAKTAVKKVKEFIRDGLNFNDTADYFLKFAEAIGILVASVAILGAMDPVKVYFGLGIILTIMLAVYTFNLKMRDGMKGQKMADQLGFAAQLLSFAVLIVAIAAAVALIAIAIMPLAALGWGAMGRALILVGGFLAMIGGFLVGLMAAMKALTKDVRKKDRFKTMMQLSATVLILSVAMIAISAAVSMLALSIAPLAGMGWDAMGRALILVAGFMLVLGGSILLMIMALKKLTAGSSHPYADMLKLAGIMTALSVSMLILSAAISVLAIAIVPLAALDWGSMGRALIVITAMLVLLGGFMIGMLLALKQVTSSIMSGGAKDSWNQIGMIAALVVTMSVSMAILAVAIGVLAIALLPFALMSWDNLWKAMVALAVILGVVGEFFIMMTKNFQKVIGSTTMTAKDIGKMTLLMMSMSAMMVLLSGAIFVFSLALVPFSMMETKAFMQAMSAFIVLMAMMRWFISEILGMVSDFAEDDKGLGKALATMGAVLVFMLGMAGVVAVFAVVIGMLGNMKLEALVAGTVALGALIAYIVIMVNKVKELGESNLKFSNVMMIILVMVGIAGAAILLSFAINEVKHIKWEVIAAFTAGLGVLILTTAEALKIASSIPSFGAGIKGILLIAAAIAAIVGVLILLVPLLLDSIGNALVDFSAKLALIGPMMTGFADDMNDVDQSGIDNAETTFDKLIGMFTKLQAVTGFRDTIRDFYNAMFNLSSGLDLFVRESTKLGDPESNNAFATLEKLNDIQETVRSLNFGDLSNKLFDLALGLYIFDYFGKGMEDPTTSRSIATLTTLAGQANNLDTLSRLQLTALTSQLAGLGGAMMLYAQGAEAVAGYSGNEAPSVDSAVGFLATVVNSLVGDDGSFTIPELPKEEDLGVFGAELAALAGALGQFVDASNGWTGSTDKAVALLDFLVNDLRPKLSEETISTVTAFEDNGVKLTDIQLFARDIFALGGALNSFITSTKDASNDNVGKALSALDFFADLKEKLNRDTVSTVIDVFGLFHYERQGVVYSLEQFAGDLDQLGYGLSQFVGQVQFTSEEVNNMDHAISAMKKIALMTSSLPTIEGAVNWFTGHQYTISEFASQLIPLGTGIGKMIRGVHDALTEGGYTFDYHELDSITEFFIFFIDMYDTINELLLKFGLAPMDQQAMFNELNEFATNTVRGFTEVIKALDEEFAHGTPGKPGTMLDALTSVIVQMGGAVQAAKEQLGENVSLEDIRNFATTLRELIGIYSDSIRQDVESNLDPDDFYSAGYSIPQGIVLGINAGRTIVGQACSQLGAYARSSFMESIDSNSPSKVFREIGVYIPEGAALGVEDGAPIFISAIHDMTKEAIGDSGEAIGAIAALLGEDLDVNPVISPVLDLTNLSSGIEQMRDMINGGGAPTIDTYLASRYAANSIPSGSAVANQNGTDFGGIYDRIAQLNGSITELGDKIKGMKLVLDTGAVAGGLADELDSILGKREFYEQRRA